MSSSVERRPGRTGGPRRWLAAAAVALVVATAGALAYGFTRTAGGASGFAAPQLGRPAPDFRLETLDGSSVALSGLTGRPVVINFWASYCIPCRDEAPLLEDAQIRYGGAGLAVLGVVFQDDTGAAAAFMEQFGLTYPGLLDPNGQTAIDYGVRGIPETFVVDRDGTVARVFIGPLEVGSFRAAIEAIL